MLRKAVIFDIKTYFQCTSILSLNSRKTQTLLNRNIFAISRYLMSYGSNISKKLCLFLKYLPRYLNDVPPCMSYYYSPYKLIKCTHLRVQSTVPEEMYIEKRAFDCRHLIFMNSPIPNNFLARF